jgi:hypothetical protein
MIREILHCGDYNEPNWAAIRPSCASVRQLEAYRDSWDLL